MKMFINRSFIGIFFGGFIAVLFTILNILFADMELINGPLFVKNSIGSILCGWFFTVSPLYFEIRRLSLTQQTVLHFITVMILYFVLALTIEWIPFNMNAILLSLVISILIYAIFWISFYLYFKYQAHKLNIELKNLR
nr:DUF3021 domain-containing protein [Lysinibacillus timonensis]